MAGVIVGQRLSVPGAEYKVLQFLLVGRMLLTLYSAV